MPAEIVAMSSPDDVSKLKAKVEVYESELLEVQKAIANYPTQGTAFQQSMWVAGMLRYLDITHKLLEVFREYTTALERLVPR